MNRDRRVFIPVREHITELHCSRKCVPVGGAGRRRSSRVVTGLSSRLDC